MSEKIRILIADDHPILREGLKSVLATQTDFEVVGEAATGREVIRQVGTLEPDVILLDLEMPEMDGVETIQLLGEREINVPIIVFTVFDTDERIVASLKAGAQGYLLKGTPREELFNAVRVVHSGGSLLQPVVASKFLKKISKGFDQLTPRELEVTTLLSQGLQNKEIATQLSITERTVKFHVSSVLSKLGADNRTEAVKIAVQQGLISL